MKRILLVLLVVLIAVSAGAQFKFSGSTGATAYANTAFDVGNVDIDQDILLSYAPVSLAINVGFTHTWLEAVDPITFGYTLSASQAFGAFTVGGSIASNSLTILVDGSPMTGDWVGDIKANASFKATDQLTIAADLLMSAKKTYAPFQAIDIGAVYNPFPWLSLTAGGAFMDAQTVVDDVGYVRGIAAVEGLSFYAKAKISY